MSDNHIQNPWIVMLPKKWTPARADAVYEFLSLLADAIFCAYEEPLIDIAQREAIDRSIYGSEATYPEELDEEDFVPF